jgi:hypothetical protein
MLKKVKNEGRHGAANEHYHQLRDGGVDYLFSDSQLETAYQRALGNPEDLDWGEFQEDFWLGMFYGTVLGSLLCGVVYGVYIWIG